MAIVDTINVKCDGEIVTEIVDGSGKTLKTLSAEVENDSQYYKPTVVNAGGELAAGSTIEAGTYFTGSATVPSGGGDGFTSSSWVTAVESQESEKTVSNAMNSIVPIPTGFNGWILVRFGYSSAPTNGEKSIVQLCVYLKNGAIVNGIYRYYNSLTTVSIGDYLFYEGGNAGLPVNNSLVKNQNGYISCNSNFVPDAYIPAGGTIEYAYIPINFTELTYEGAVQ